MNVYTNTTFTGHWPVGTSAIVVARTAEMAAEALMAELARIGLPQHIDPQSMNRLSTYAPTVLVLQGGNY